MSDASTSTMTGTSTGEAPSRPIIDLSPWLGDQRPRRAVAADIAETYGVSMAQASLLLCVGGPRAPRKTPTRVTARRPAPDCGTAAGGTGAAYDAAVRLTAQLGPAGHRGVVDQIGSMAVMSWRPAAGTHIEVEFTAEGRGTVAAVDPKAGRTTWPLDERGIRLLTAALRVFYPSG